MFLMCVTYITALLILLTSPPESNLGRAHHSRTTMQQSPHWLQWDAPNSPPQLPLPLRWSPPLSNTPIPRPTPLTIPMASGSNQPFCHSTLSGQTDRLTHRQTNRWASRQVGKISAYTCYIARERHTNSSSNNMARRLLCWMEKIQAVGSIAYQ